MPKFNANLTMPFNEVQFLDRFEAAANAGFKGVEYLFPYPYKREELAERLAKHGLTQVLHNLPAGDWAAGERGIATIPGREGEFEDGVGKAIEYATALGCKQVNCLAGIPPKDASADKVRETFVKNLKFAASSCRRRAFACCLRAARRQGMGPFGDGACTQKNGQLRHRPEILASPRPGEDVVASDQALGASANDEIHKIDGRGGASEQRNHPVAQ